MRLFYSPFLVFALASFTVAAQAPSQAEASSPQAEQSGSQEQEWSKLARNTDRSLYTISKPTTRRQIYLRLQPEDSEWDSMTDDVMQLHIQDTALETASTFKLGRSYDEKKKQLSFKNGYIPVKQDVPLLESEPTISLAGFWGKSNGIPIKKNVPIVPVVPKPTKFIEIRWHIEDGWQVCDLKTVDVEKMKLQTAKTVYTLNTTQLEEYESQMVWQRLYQNPDGRLKTTPGSERDVFLRLQEDSWPWDLMTDDVMKLSSPEGSTAPERATIYRLGRIYEPSTKVLHFNEQYNEVPGKKDVSLVGLDRSDLLPDGTNLPLTGFWGRSVTRPGQSSDTNSVAVAVPTEFIQIRWHKESLGEWSGWQVQFLKKWEVDKMKLRTAKTTYTLSPTQLEEYKHITDGWQRLYQNPDRRLKTTPESEWDVFFRLQEDSWPWNVMTDDVMKFSSLEGSTAPERATIYRLGRTYTRSTSVLLFKEQYKAVPGKQDVSLDASDRSYPLLDGKVQPSFPLTGFWGRRKTRDSWLRSDTPMPVAQPTEFIQIRWHKESPGEWSGWQVRFLKKEVVTKMKLQTAKTTYTLDEEGQALFDKFRRKGNRGITSEPPKKKPRTGDTESGI